MVVIDLSAASDACTISKDANSKSIAVKCTLRSDTHPDGALSLILAHRQAFEDAPDVLSVLASAGAKEFKIDINLVSENDIYHYFSVLLKTGNGESSLPVMRFTVIHPATARHIAKYSTEHRVLVRESPELYAQRTLPYIAALGCPTWVSNLMSDVKHGRALPPGEMLVHAEHVDDDARGFAIFADSKWDRRDMESLYLLALPVRGDLRSLRDLDSTHLPLLDGIAAAVRTAVPARFPEVCDRQLRCFFHYQPTYYHLHVHIVHVDRETQGMSVAAAHLLDDVIDNIRNVAGDYYQKRTLTFAIGEHHELANA